MPCYNISDTWHLVLIFIFVAEIPKKFPDKFLVRPRLISEAVTASNQRLWKSNYYLYVICINIYLYTVCSSSLLPFDMHLSSKIYKHLWNRFAFLLFKYNIVQRMIYIRITYCIDKKDRSLNRKLYTSYQIIHKLFVIRFSDLVVWHIITFIFYKFSIDT